MGKESHYKGRLIKLIGILSIDTSFIHNQGWMGGVFKLIVESPEFEGLLTYETLPSRGTTVYYAGYYEFKAISAFLDINEDTSIWLTDIEGLNTDQILSKMNYLLKHWDVRGTHDYASYWRSGESTSIN